MTATRRSQTSTEYLIILAVVIIVALIIVSTLGGIPSIGGSSDESVARAKLESLPIGITDYTFYTWPAELTLRNNQPRPVKIMQIWIDDHACNITDMRLDPGMSKMLRCSHGTADETYTYRLAIEYQDAETGATYSINDSSNRFIGTHASGLDYSCGENGTTSVNITGAECDFNLDGVADTHLYYANFYFHQYCTAETNYCMGADMDCDGYIDVSDITEGLGYCP